MGADLIARLEAENDELRERIRQLQNAAGIMEPTIPMAARLTHMEARIVGALQKQGTVSTAALMNALYFDRTDEPNVKIVDVYICKARKKLAPFGVVIETVWGQGYTMSAQHRRALAELVQEEAA